MKSEVDIKHFYRTELVPRIQELESLRAKVNRLHQVVLIVLVLSFFVVPILAKKVSTGALAQSGFLIGGLATLIGLVGVMIWSNRLWQRYKGQYKKAVVSRVVSQFNSEWDFDPNRGLPRSLYERSELFRQKIDRFHSEDGISGKIDKKFFACSEVHTQKLVSNGKNRRYVDVFRGLMVVLEFDRAQAGKTIVLPDLAEKHLGNYFGKILQDLNFSRADLVNMENPEFEKHFVVYSDNSLESHHILTPAMMERLLSLRAHASQKIALSFMHQRVFIAIALRKDFFEPRLFQKVTLRDIELLFEILSLIRHVMDEVRMDEKVTA